MEAKNTSQPKINAKQHIALIAYIIGLIFKNHKTYSIFFTATLLLSALIPAAAIWTAKLILDELSRLIQQTGSIVTLLQWIGVEVSLLIGRSLLQKQVNLMTSKFTSLFKLDMQSLLIKNNDTLKYHYFEDNHFYNQYDIASSQVINSASSYLMLLVNLFRSAIQIITVSSLLAIVDIWLLIAIIVINVINFFITMKINQRQFKIINQTTEKRRHIQYLYELMTDIRFIRDLRLFRISDRILHRFTKHSKENIDINLRLEKKEIRTFMYFETFTTLVYYSFYIYIAIQIAHGVLSLGDIALFQQSYNTLDGSLSGISGSYINLYENNLYLKIFHDLLFNPHYKLAHQSQNTLQTIQKIELKNIRFSYPNKPDNTIIQNCNLSIKKGDCIAITGNNGTGKSTLLKIISGLFTPSEGSIIIDQTQLHQITTSHYQQRLSVMLQDYNQYECSLLDNITNFDSDVDQLQLDYVIQFTQLNNLIAELPQGIETVLSKRFLNGTAISSGQWQRIALARTLYKRSDILILDEPTAYIDNDFTQYFFASLKELQSLYQAILVVTHKHNYLQYFNKIFYHDPAMNAFKEQ